MNVASLWRGIGAALGLLLPLAASAGYTVCGDQVVANDLRQCPDGSLPMYQSGDPPRRVTPPLSPARGYQTCGNQVVGREVRSCPDGGIPMYHAGTPPQGAAAAAARSERVKPIPDRRALTLEDAAAGRVRQGQTAPASTGETAQRLGLRWGEALPPIDTEDRVIGVDAYKGALQEVACTAMSCTAGRGWQAGSTQVEISGRADQTGSDFLVLLCQDEQGRTRDVKRIGITADGRFSGSIDTTNFPAGRYRVSLGWYEGDYQHFTPVADGRFAVTRAGAAAATPPASNARQSNASGFVGEWYAYGPVGTRLVIKADGTWDTGMSQGRWTAQGDRIEMDGNARGWCDGKGRLEEGKFLRFKCVKPYGEINFVFGKHS